MIDDCVDVFLSEPAGGPGDDGSYHGRTGPFLKKAVFYLVLYPLPGGPSMWELGREFIIFLEFSAVVPGEFVL